MPSLGTLLHLLSLLVADAGDTARRLAGRALPALSLLSTRERLLDRELPVARYVKQPQHGVEHETAATERCAFCLSGIEDGDEVRVLRCRHLFHRCCLDRWLAARPGATCPLCRGPLLTAPCAGEGQAEEGMGMATFMAYVLRRGWFWLFGM